MHIFDSSDFFIDRKNNDAFGPFKTSTTKLFIQKLEYFVIFKNKKIRRVGIIFFFSFINIQFKKQHLGSTFLF